MNRAMLVAAIAVGILVRRVHTPAVAWAQRADIGFERSRMKQALERVARRVKENYHDPTLRGLDWERLVEQARVGIDKALSVREMLTTISALVRRLDDSHTFFIPPEMVTLPLFGFDAKAFGEEILIYRVEEGGAAVQAGLQRGDRILKINGLDTDRRTLDWMMFYLRAVNPQRQLEIVYKRGDESPRVTRVVANLKQRKAVVDYTDPGIIFELLRQYELNRVDFHSKMLEEGIGYLRIPSFVRGRHDFQGMVKKVRNSRAVVIDLRSNLGGSLDDLRQSVGLFETQPTVIGDMVMRSKTEPIKTRPQQPNYAGPLFILVDSQTSSAAEIFARHFQRTRRAVIIGDRTSGRVTVANIYTEAIGIDTVAVLGVAVSIARVVFPGGEELEGRGLTPDTACLPTPDDLREERDPCRDLAVKLARGVPASATSDRH